mgnify:CR=1 FL=1
MYVSRRVNQWGLALGVALLLVSLWALCDFAWAQASAPALVSIDRADAVYGPQHYECWLTHFQYNYPTMVIDCHSDIDAIFGNGFDPLPEPAP